MRVVDSILILACAIALAEGKGLYSGVPCHLAYKCIFEENEDGFDNSVLVGTADGVADERSCQDLCQAH